MVATEQDKQKELQRLRNAARLRLARLEAAEKFKSEHSRIDHLIEKLEYGTKEEKIFAEKTIVQHLPAIYKAIQLVAKKNNIPLS